jgi:hypothetical protein
LIRATDVRTIDIISLWLVMTEGANPPWQADVANSQLVVQGTNTNNFSAIKWLFCRFTLCALVYVGDLLNILKCARVFLRYSSL